jgi:hypothetical protein
MRVTIVFILNFTILLTTFSIPAWAFFEWKADDISLDMCGMVRGFSTAYKYPDNEFLYDEKSDINIAGIARLLMQGQVGQHLSFEVNTYQTYIPMSLISLQAGLGTPLDVERSTALEWSFSEDDYMHLTIDQLNVSISHNHLDLIIGRQPINMATTFYFTPNDLFAPFVAQTFYRVYKPGVDAIRAEVRLGNLTQLSLFSVLGYKRDFNSNTGWSDSPDSDRNSYLGRFSTAFYNFEWALLGGSVREANIIGGSLQGELFQWLGVRAEGHVTYPDNSHRDSYSEVTIGIEHSWENNLDLRLEQFYHGSGANSVSDYGDVLTAAYGESAYLGRNYTAFGISYEFTPLIYAQMLALANLTDHSYLLSFNAIYSLSDEAELAINLGVPIGNKAEGKEIKSEFGLYPYSMNIEVRFYF